MSTDMQMPGIVANFISLSPRQAARYDEIKELISDVLREDDGLMFVMNAAALRGDTTLSKMQMWCDKIAASEHDSRSLGGIIDERPLEIPRFAD